MKLCHLVLVLWGILIVLPSNIQICSSCLFEERQALLDFKASLNETNYPDLILPSWIDHHDHPTGSDSDCCSWEGVKCSVTTGRIVELQLGDLSQHIRQSYSFHFYATNWSPNLSILHPIENLQALDLSFNGFHDSILGIAPFFTFNIFFFLCSLILAFQNLGA